MAQDTQDRTEPTEQTEARGRDSRFHYYSGGEVKEVEGTRVSPILYAFWGVVIVGAIGYFLFGGALGPNAHSAFRPVGGSTANLANLQDQLNRTGTAAGLTYASVDLTQLPIPQGQTISQAISQGADVYQTYCIGCHGPNQDGNGVNASSLNPKPRNLRDAPFMQGMSYQRINTSLHKGVPGTAMPRWENTLTETQIGDVISYVFSLTSPAPGAPAGGAPATPAANPGQTANPGTHSGGSKTYVSGIQNSPKPITPAINGNPTAPTNTAPPSLSGPTPDQTHDMMAPQGAGAGASKNLAPSSPMAGGESVGSAPAPAVPMPGSDTPTSRVTPNPPGSGAGTGM